jgi:hypothetical protein
MEKLLEVIKTLLTLGTQIKFLIDGHETLTENSEYINKIKFKDPHHANLPLDKSVSGFLQNYMKIISCSFLDEYNEELTPGKHPEFKTRILRLKQITKPVMKRINQWKDLKDFRNNLLAHNLRIKGRSIYSGAIGSLQYNIPHTNNEHVLLCELLIILTTIVSQEFNDVFHQLNRKETLKDKLKFNYPQVDVEAEKRLIWNEVNEIRSKL